ncbi:hypothetical Protein YC6258_00935 [Gynuella sunshinyii YC6258]|uniref:Uncharacterized protein n=1 Tax=Gynuella sunshinyii YC6258 TaxID=1445510 RepID=A0A0C5V090_9GAMM|nr:hypothetical Protein YC6258_00935 [Gynuella sunshinyii YC6258]
MANCKHVNCVWRNKFGGFEHSIIISRRIKKYLWVTQECEDGKRLGWQYGFDSNQI